MSANAAAASGRAQAILIALDAAHGKFFGDGLGQERVAAAQTAVAEWERETHALAEALDDLPLWKLDDDEDAAAVSRARHALAGFYRRKTPEDA